MKSSIHRNTASAFLPFTIILLMAAIRTSADDPRRSTISRAMDKISIDGVFDEPDWARAVPIGEITQREPKPGLAVSSLMQFDDESRNLGWQSRLRWIIRPGSDLFLVFNQGWLQDERGGLHFRNAGTRLAGKIQYTFRF